jgi:hypothetical protein
MDFGGFRDYLLNHIASQEDFRWRTASQHPGDERNQNSARALAKLHASLSALPESEPAWARAWAPVSELRLSGFSEADPLLDELTVILGEQLRIYGFHDLSDGDPIAFLQDLANALQNETARLKRDVQQEALLALGRIATPDALVQLREWAQPGGKLLGRKPLAVRMVAVKALALAGPAAVDIMGSLERDEAPEIRAAASAALAALRP